MTEDNQIPTVELGSDPITQRSRDDAEVHVVVVHRGNTATIIALDVETFAPVGHLIHPQTSWPRCPCSGRRDPGRRYCLGMGG